MTFTHRIEKAVRLSVMDSRQEIWWPVWGYDGQICAYAPIEEATSIYLNDATASFIEREHNRRK